jgi:uncharacterized protein (DUF2132 family)
VAVAAPVLYYFAAKQFAQSWRLNMSNQQPKNPMHGVTLEQVVTRLYEHYGWDGLAQRIDINCFKVDPSIKSSLKFLRRTQWAREKVESLYISTFE